MIAQLGTIFGFSGEAAGPRSPGVRGSNRRFFEGMESMGVFLQRTLLAAPATFLWTVAALAQQTPEAAAPAAPAASALNTGDTAWMLTSVALVLMMTIPGLALFYGGMVRKMNVLATVMQSFAVTCLVTVLWTVVTYSMAFTSGSPFVGGFSRFLLMA